MTTKAIVRLYTITLSFVLLSFSNINSAIVFSIAKATKLKTNDSTYALSLVCKVKNTADKIDSVRLMRCSFSDNISVLSNVTIQLSPESCTNNAAKTFYLRKHESIVRTVIINSRLSKIDSEFWIKLGLKQCLPRQAILRNMSSINSQPNMKLQYIDTATSNIVWTDEYKQSELKIQEQQ